MRHLPKRREREERHGNKGPKQRPKESVTDVDGRQQREAKDDPEVSGDSLR